MTGFNLYGRTAPFADCDRFRPPSGTRFLCERRPPERRPGPYYYGWGPDPPYYERLSVEPGDARVAGSFARAAISAQPLDYLGAVATDLVRYVVPTAGPDRRWGGTPPSEVWFANHSPVAQPFAEEVMAANYAETYTGVGGPSTGGAGETILDWYQWMTRVRGPLVALLAIVTLAGLALGRGRLRVAAALFAVTAAWLYVLPVLTLSWDVRYGLVPTELLAAGAALSVAALRERSRESRVREPREIPVPA
jgi:hypothetical protein